MVDTLKDRPTTPAPFRQDTRMEKIRPETTGAGMAYFRRGAEGATIQRPKKITMAAKPRLVRYSNLKVLSAPSTPAVYSPK